MHYVLGGSLTWLPIALIILLLKQSHVSRSFLESCVLLRFYFIYKYNSSTLYYCCCINIIQAKASKYMNYVLLSSGMTS